MRKNTVSLLYIFQYNIYIIVAATLQQSIITYKRREENVANQSEIEGKAYTLGSYGFLYTL
jgi:hypothetical protein